MRDEANTGIQVVIEGRERIRSLLISLLLPLLVFSGLSWNTAFLHESAALAAEGGVVGGKCSDPVFVQTEARLRQALSVADKIRGWKEFISLHPDSPCVDLAHRRLDDLQKSRANKEHELVEQRWLQEARGGVVEPNRDLFPSHAVLNDAFAADRVRVLSEVIFLADGWKSEHGEQNRALSMERNSLWTMVIRGELALVSHLGLTVDIPMAVGQPGGKDLQAALGNISLGIKGIWGTALGPVMPWVVSAGVVWGSGSSVFSADDKAVLLDAAAVGSAYMRHLYLYDSPDYIVHAESQLGMGEHFFSLGLAYHVFAGGEHVEKILRVDAAWDWRMVKWATLGVEINGGLGSAEPVVGAVTNEFVAYVYAAPVFRITRGSLGASLAFRIPLMGAWEWARFVSSVDLSLGF